MSGQYLSLLHVVYLGTLLVAEVAMPACLTLAALICTGRRVVTLVTRVRTVWTELTQVTHLCG